MGNYCSQPDKRIDTLTREIQVLRDMITNNINADLIDTESIASIIESTKTLRADITAIQEKLGQQESTCTTGGRVCIAQYSELENAIDSLNSRVAKLERDMKKVQENCHWWL